MNDPNNPQAPPTIENRRAERRVPAVVLGDIRSRLVGGREFTLLNYTSDSLYGQSHSRLLVGSRISVRLATSTLNAIVTGRVIRASLTAVINGVPSYEVAVSLDHPVDWIPDLPPVPVPGPGLDAASVLDTVSVPVGTSAQAE
jgi:hypothetical protein